MSLPLAIYMGLGLVAFMWLLIGMLWYITGGGKHWGNDARIYTLPFTCWMAGGVLGLVLWRLTS